MKLPAYLLCLLSAVVSFSQLKSFGFPKPVDTSDKPITLQPKKVYQVGDHLSVDNLFDGARISDLTVENDSSFTILIEPENTPINSSPWYAFRIVKTSSSHQKVSISVKYGSNYKHRYWPKISSDAKKWIHADSSRVVIANDASNFILTLPIQSDTIWIAAQPLETTAHVKKWCEKVV